MKSLFKPLVRYNFSSGQQTVGFVGLGAMGRGMFRNLAKKHKVVGYEIHEQTVQELKTEGFEMAGSIEELASKTTNFVTMLPAAQHVKEFLGGDKGLLKYCKKDSLIIDSSTIGTTAAVEFHGLCKKSGVNYMDAPVSGGMMVAAAGGLTFMVGAENESNFGNAKNILDPMGKNIINCAKPGAGQTAKLCNNMGLAIEMIGMGEVLALGKKLGIDMDILIQIINCSSARCWSSDTYCPVPGIKGFEHTPANKDYDIGFMNKLMLKDLGLALDAAKQVDAQIPFGTEAHSIYKWLNDEGLASKDFGIIYKIFDENKFNKK